MKEYPDSPDRNKTELTHNVTRMAVMWLDGKGFKPVETEVGIGTTRGWVADVAGVIAPTQTECVELKLIRRSPRYRYDRHSDDGYNERHRDECEQWRGEFNKLPGILTAIIEVKTSVNDFRRDIKFQLDGYGATNLRYVAIPTGLMAQEKWPKDWGILLYGEPEQPELNGNTLTPTMRCVRPSPLFNVTIEQSRAVILQIAIRRDNVTRYQRLRAFDKHIRIDDAERKLVTRLNSAMTFVVAIAEGKTVEDAKLWAGIRNDLPNYTLERIAAFRRQLEEKSLA